MVGSAGTCQPAAAARRSQARRRARPAYVRTTPGYTCGHGSGGKKRAKLRESNKLEAHTYAASWHAELGFPNPSQNALYWRSLRAELLRRMRIGKWPCLVATFTLCVLLLQRCSRVEPSPSGDPLKRRYEELHARTLAAAAAQHGQRASLGSTPARLLRLLQARPAVPGGSALPGW